MKALESRIKALESEMSPREMIMGMLDCMADFEDMDGFIVWCYTDVALNQMKQSGERLYESIRRKHGGQRDQAESDRACRKAYQSFNYLIALAMAPSTQLDLARYRYLYSVSTVAHWLGALWRNFKAECELDTLAQELARLKHLMEPLWVELIRERLASEDIGKRYFGSRSLYFKRQVSFLELVTGHVQAMAVHANEAVELLQMLKPDMEIEKTLLIDQRNIQAMAEAQAIHRVEQLEQEARLRVYEAEGRHGEAMRFLKKVFMG